jgi:hypothetical protein
MRVVHGVITTQAYKQALQRGEMNHKMERPAMLFYGKGRYDKVTYEVKGKKYPSKCSFYSKDIIPFDLDLPQDLKHFDNSHRTFVNHIATGQNYSVKICEVDNDGNFVREVPISEVLELELDA